MPLFRVRVGANSNSCSGILTRAFLAFSSLAPSSVDPLSPQRTCATHTHITSCSSTLFQNPFHRTRSYFHSFNAANPSSTVIRGVHRRPVLLGIAIFLFILYRESKQGPKLSLFLEK